MRSRRDDHGAVAIITALVTCFVLFTVAALAVDIGNVMARSGSLQLQMDRAAKFAAEQLPVDSTTVAATPSADQLRVARAAAYYLACNAVRGQESAVTLPACPTSASSTTLDSYASTLLANGRTAGTSPEGEIWFPSVNEVRLVGPRARVDYGFARAIGKDGAWVSRSAGAVALSPGQVLPVALSATCIASAIGAAPGGTGDAVSSVVPINYVSTGAPAASGSSAIVDRGTDTVLTYFTDVEVGNKAGVISLDPRSSISPSGVMSLYLNYTSNKNGFTVEQLTIYIRRNGFAQGDTTGGYSFNWSPALLDQLKTSGTALFTGRLPAGDYEGMVIFTGRNGGVGNQQTWIDNKHVEFTVPNRGAMNNMVTCARPLQSPRLGMTVDADAMAVNLAQGLDHRLVAFPGLGDAVDGVSLPGTTSPASVAGLYGTVDSLFRCNTNSNVKLDYPTRRTDGANCVHVDTTQDWSSSLTRGLLTGGTGFTGRLRCASASGCNHSASRPTLTNPGGIQGIYNNDRFEDFITNRSLLNDPFLMSLDSFISPRLPLVTPPSDVVDDALYQSPRFFWAPVVLKTFVTSVPGEVGDYSVLGFRPVFLTGEEPASTAVSSIDMMLLRLVQQATAAGYDLQSVLKDFGDTATSLNPCGATVSLVSLLTGLLTSTQSDACTRLLLRTRLYSSTTSTTTTVARFLHKYLGTDIRVADTANTQSFGGLVIDTAAARVRAARLMTINPGALPVVLRDYAGPTTTYLGVGPKIIRLVK